MFKKLKIHKCFEPTEDDEPPHSDHTWRPAVSGRSTLPAPLATIKLYALRFRWSGVSIPTVLQHYCRVCNIQLNSCRQAKIHTQGKKHEKRLTYLRFCIENSQGEGGELAGQRQEQQQQQQQQQQQHGVHYPTVYTPPFYYPAHLPSYLPPSTSQYQDYRTPHPGAGPPRYGSHQLEPPSRGGGGVMSPSLTSGFSGSGDCKSTETSSLLSVASNSSRRRRGGRRHERAAASQSLECRLCRLPFPSRAVLEHHLAGARHARKVAAAAVLQRLVDQGAELGGDLSEIRCEVCRVSVNSSHQLQAHLAG